MSDVGRAQPQLTTSSRLLHLGESIEFRFHVPPHVEAGDLAIFPRYLEQAEPGPAFRAGDDLGWVEGLPRESLPVHLRAGAATVTYKPQHPGSYLARWAAGGEAFFRYFAAIEDDWVVLRFSTFEQLQADPPLHATGIAVDYRLHADRFDPNDPLFREFLDFHRRFGCSVIPLLPDTPDLSHAERVAAYGTTLKRVHALMPDPSNCRSARLEMHHAMDPGYTRALAELGVNDHCGLFEANARPWLGMPEFPYFSSGVDCRKANQRPGGDVVAHQWDFCGGWHFIGPVSWHFKAAAGDWDMAERCVRTGLEELANAARLSGHPVFAVPLYDGVTPPGYPNPVFRYRAEEPRRVADGTVAGGRGGAATVARDLRVNGDGAPVGASRAANAGCGSRLVDADSWTEANQRTAASRAGDGATQAREQTRPEPGTPDAAVHRPDEWTRGDQEVQDDAGMRDFVERYQRLIALEFPKRFRVAFARSVDIADYFRRHFPATPRTVFVSRTDHLLYDMWWLCHWCNDYQLVPRERIPWLTRMSVLMAQRRGGVTRYKDPLSCEYVLVEDQRRSIRFERDCPNPIWWFDYTHQEAGPQGSASEPTETPDVTVRLHPWQREAGRLTTQVYLETAAEFPDYAVCLWGLPDDVDPNGPVETTAREAIMARNLQGECHLVLCFDLGPGARIEVNLRRR